MVPLVCRAWAAAVSFEASLWRSTIVDTRQQGAVELDNMLTFFADRDVITENLALLI